MLGSIGDVSSNVHCEKNESDYRYLLIFVGTYTFKMFVDPYCWTEYNLTTDVGLGRGTAWAWPDFLLNGEITDEQCRSNYIPPIVAMQGHSAPLGLVFYEFTDNRPEVCGDISPFPESYDGYAFIAFHGSWNRDVPTGYNVMYIPFDGNGNVNGPPVTFLAHEPPNAQWEDGFRPVDVDFDACGRLIVTSDGTFSEGSKVVLIQYNNSSNATNATSAPSDLSEDPSEIDDSISTSPTLTPSITCPCPLPRESSTEPTNLESSGSYARSKRPVVLGGMIVALVLLCASV